MIAHRYRRLAEANRQGEGGYDNGVSRKQRRGKLEERLQQITTWLVVTVVTDKSGWVERGRKTSSVSTS